LTGYKPPQYPAATRRRLGARITQTPIADPVCVTGAQKAQEGIPMMWLLWVVIVGLIAAMRRILVVTAEFSVKGEAQQGRFREGMIEIALLTVMVVALVGSLLMLRSKARTKNEQVAAGR